MECHGLAGSQGLVQSGERATTPTPHPTLGAVAAIRGPIEHGRPTLDRRGDAIDRRGRGQSASGGTSFERGRPPPSDPDRDHRGAQTTGAQQCRDHLLLARTSRGTTHALDAPPQHERVIVARPQPQQRLDATASDPQIVDRLLVATMGATDVAPHRLGEPTQGGGRDLRLHTVVRIAFLRSRIAVTRSHNSSEIRPSLRVESSVSKPYSRASPSSSSMMRRW